ncbi:MAG: efflux RND transporter periplasmic adaptor subunit [Acidobacteriota bacterium]|nr:efflux RND transporter periplasmic adaptor subunit [Acidobacteriota bacterium]
MTISSKRTVVATWIVLLLGGGILAQEGPPPAIVETSTVTSERITESVELAGTVRAVLDSLVASEVDGRVADRRVENGDRVSKGQALIGLDSARLDKSLAFARAEEDEVAALLELAERQEKRARELYEDEVVSIHDLDQAVSNRQSLEGRLEGIRVRIASIEDDIARTRIRAPFSGVVTEIHTEVGEWISQGDPVVRLSSLSTLEIELDVPERYFPLLTRGDAATATIEAMPGVTLEGEVFALVPRADSDARTFPVIIRAPNPGGAVGGGMLARVSLSLASGSNVLLVPKDAIVRQAQRQMVFIVDGGTVRAVSVRTGRSTGSRVEVSGELDAGDEVVIRGNERLAPGQSVHVETKTARSGASAGN